MPLRVGVIVEGQGEYQAIRILLERIWYELLGGDHIDVRRPFRQPQGTLLREEGLKQAVDAVKIKLGPDATGGLRTLVLILIDAESRCPKDLAPARLLGQGCPSRRRHCLRLTSSDVRDVVRGRGGIARRSEWPAR